MSRGLRSTLAVYDDYFSCSPKELNEIIDKINKLGCMSFIIGQNNEVWEKILTDGINEETRSRRIRWLSKPLDKSSEIIYYKFE